MIINWFLQGGRGLLAHYGNSHINAIMDLFPDIGLEETKFIHLKSMYFFIVRKYQVTLTHFWCR